ncbi:MAG: ketoacyl-ACP synthase III [Bacteroidia bacterium]|jgi:3-oxoacyl-[acyl-carrier-protein] synthase-3|nr:ketoacyl-ACP synthase III [Bacteroidia bacterium]
MPAKVAAFTYYLPETTYTNADFANDFPETKLQTLQKIGVEKRHITPKGQTSSDLAFAAAEKLFTENSIPRSEIDFLIYCSFDYDHYTPATAGILQHRLGLSTRCGAFDMGLGCSAYVYGIATAVSLLETLQLRNVLLLTASSLTHKIHAKDRGNRFLFGDAASATLISFSEKKQTGPFTFGTDGSGAGQIMVPHGGMRTPLNETSFEESTDEFGNVTTPASFYMDGFGIFRFTVATVPGMIEETLQKAGITRNDIDLFVFHQPNVFLNELLRKKLMIPEEKFVHCMKDFGNTVQATIPIALTEALKEGRLKPGMKVLLAGFGVGLSWACGIIDYE